MTVEYITEEEAIRRGIIAEIEPWMEALFADISPILFAHAPLENLPFRYVGIGEAQGLLVICSASREADGKRWIHVSMSRHHRLPSYDDMCLVRDVFVGREQMAIQVFARKSQHVNINPNVLHLWSCLDGDPTPDFRHAGQI